MSDISNLDKDGNLLARNDRRRAFNLGNRLWHSDSSFKAAGSKYSLLSARAVPTTGGNTEFADMRAAYDALDAETKAEVEDLVTEHSLLFSRGQLGFTEFTAEERVKFAAVRHRLVRTNPATGRKSLYLSSHIGGIVGWPVPEALALVRDFVEHERETVADESQGVQLAALQEIARYWGTDYDWRKAETKLNASDAFHLVIPSLPGFGFSGKPTATGWGPERTARAWVVLMKRLGYTQFVSQGGDLGAGVNTAMGRQAPPELLGIHTNFPGTIPPDIAGRSRQGGRPQTGIATT
jgi:Taurine catabolism dioxygenase TauD, TfdA family/Epoxide hydrolase N terminus